MKLIFCLLGLLLVVEGIPYFAFPDKMKKWMIKLLEVPDSRLRTVGLLAMALGLFITYVSRQ